MLLCPRPVREVRGSIFGSVKGLLRRDHSAMGSVFNWAIFELYTAYIYNNHVMRIILYLLGVFCTFLKFTHINIVVS